MSVHPFAPRGGATLSAVTWEERLQLASSQAEVIATARDFLATLDHFDIAMLPPGCAPRKLFGAHDVSSYAFDLVAHYCDYYLPGARLMQRLATFFMSASQRLSQLAARTNDDDAPRTETA